MSCHFFTHTRINKRTCTHARTHTHTRAHNHKCGLISGVMSILWQRFLAGLPAVRFTDQEAEVVDKTENDIVSFPLCKAMIALSNHQPSLLDFLGSVLKSSVQLLLSRTRNSQGNIFLSFVFSKV